MQVAKTPHQHHNSWGLCVRVWSHALHVKHLAALDKTSPASVPSAAAFLLLKPALLGTEFQVCTPR